MSRRLPAEGGGVGINNEYFAVPECGAVELFSGSIGFALAQLCVAGVADAPFSNGGTDAFEREFEAEIRLRCKNAEETIAKID